jgi:hypothetical protein
MATTPRLSVIHNPERSSGKVWTKTVQFRKVLKTDIEAFEVDAQLTRPVKAALVVVQDEHAIAEQETRP